MTPKAKVVTLHKDHIYVTRRENETCSGGKARSYLEITAPRNTRLLIPRRFFSKMKLFNGAGAQIARYSTIFLRKIRPNDRKPVYVADYEYLHFADLPPEKQDDKNNRETLTVDLGRDLIVNPNETIGFEIIGDDAVNWDNPDTVIEFKVAEEVL